MTGRPPLGGDPLDFLSAAFDPLLALRDRDLRPPVPNATPLDNLHKARCLLPLDHPDHRPARGGGASRGGAAAPTTEPSTATGSGVASVAVGGEEPEPSAASRAAPISARALATARTSHQARLRLRDQGPAPCRVTALAESAGRQGPAGLLLAAMRSGREVAVVTRHRAGVRGRLVGTLVAFDKFVNLVLKACTESYTVRVRSSRQTTSGQTRCGWALELRKRTLSQVFLSGTSVVAVMWDPKAKTAEG